MLALSLQGFAQTELFKLTAFEPKAGQTVVTKTSSDSSGGTIMVTQGGSTQKGSMSVTRNRHFETTLQKQSGVERLSHRILLDRVTTSIELAGQTQNATEDGALQGKTTMGMRDGTGRWRLFVEGVTASGKEAVALAEYEAYENRRLFPDRPVSIGQSWPIHPGFIRHVIERDLDRTSMKANMTLKSVGMVDGERTAVLAFEIRSVGSTGAGRGRSSSAPSPRRRALGSSE